MSSPSPSDPNPNSAPTHQPDPSVPSRQTPPPMPALTASASFNRGRSGKKQPRAMKKKHQQKLDLLLRGTRLVPFSPQKTLDFSPHQDLLKRLGLWDFLHLDLDRTLRSDLVSELIATYEKAVRCGFVKGVKIKVSRADLARALGLPGARWKEGAGGGAGEIDGKADTAAIGFLLDVVDNWVLLHDDDTWMMPKEVSDWLRLLMEGSFDKVGWAVVVWFMVEKELTAAPSLSNCYYASHLQCLIRSQRPELFVEGEKEEDEVEVDDDDVEEVVEEEEDLKTGEAEENNSLELSLGNENTEEVSREDEERGFDLLDSRVVEEEIGDRDGNSGGNTGVEGNDGINDMDVEHVEEEKGYNNDGENVVDDVMDSEEGKEVAEEKREEGRISGRWLFDGKSDAGVHFLQRCGVGNGRVDENTKEMGVEGNVVGQEGIAEDDEEEEEDVDEPDENEEELGEFNVLQKFSELERLPSSNFLQVMESEQIPFNPGMQIRDTSCGEFIAARPENHVMGSTSSVYSNLGKRGIDENGDDLLQHTLGGSSKRIRTDDQWDPKSSDFNFCLEQMQHFMDKARMIYASKEQNYAEAGMNQQLLMSELHQRDNVIEQLHKLRAEDMLKRQQEVRRFEQELYMMTNLLDGYRKGLKETNRAFAEYRARCPQLDEPLYRDIPGSGGLVLSNADFEKLQEKKEEEERLKLLMIKDKLNEAEDILNSRFEAHREAVNMLDTKLLTIEKQFADIKELAARRKLSQTTTASPSKE